MKDRIGFGIRAIAYLVDWIAILVVGTLLGSLLGGMLGAGAAGAVTGEGAIAAAGGIVGMLIGAMVGIGLAGVFWMFWEGLTGMTLGKLVVGIKVGGDDGKATFRGKLMLRAAVKYSYSVVSFLASVTGFALLMPLATLCWVVVLIGCFFALGQTRQALHDMAAGTAVYRKETLV